jgi:hypothetical protein
MMIGAFGYPFDISGLWYFEKRGSSVYAIMGGWVMSRAAWWWPLYEVCDVVVDYHGVVFVPGQL